MLINNIEFTVGADPEVFVTNDNGLVSAHNMVGGTKEEPQPVKNGAVQVDGMALEFNIDPCKNQRQFVSRIKNVMGQLEGMIPEGHKLEIASTANFGKEYIDQQPDEAKILGCDPDYNAYTGGVNPAPDADMPFRTAAGHIHIGWGDDMDVNDPNLIEACKTLVKNLDAFVGFPSLILDEDNERRKLYGQAGAYRPKPYGVEYRVLSNFWLKNEAYMKWVYQAVRKAIIQSMEYGAVNDRFQLFVQEHINKGDNGLDENGQFFRYYSPLAVRQIINSAKELKEEVHV